MARQYSLNTFLRLAPNELLRQFLARYTIGLDLAWDTLRDTQIGPIAEAIGSAPESARLQVETAFRDIDAMASDGGVQTLLDEARHPKHRLDWSGTLAGMGSQHEFAFWAFLEHRGLFDIARQFNHADSLPNRSWRKRTDLPEAKPATDPESRERLGEAISFYYREKEGRGQICHVDHYLRDERLYWFAYPQDWARTELDYDEDGEFRVRPSRPAFEVIFVHSPDERSLDLYAQGGKQTAHDLQKLFGRAILGADLDDPDEPPPAYDLSGLLRRDFPFPVDPADGIDGVRVTRLRLSILGRGSRRITLEADAQRDAKAVYDLLEDVLAGGRIPRDLLSVGHVGLRIVFRQSGKRRSRTLTFSVSHPDSCTLKHDPKELLARKYLKEWGIDVSGRPSSGSQGSRGRAQYLLRGD